MTIEDDEKMYQESFGGNNSTRSAYGLIYVNENIASISSAIPISEYCKGASLEI